MSDLNIRNIDEKILREFKVLCAREGKTLREKVLELVKKSLRDTKSLR